MMTVLPCGDSVNSAPCFNCGKGTNRGNSVNGAPHYNGGKGTPHCDGV